MKKFISLFLCMVFMSTIVGVNSIVVTKGGLDTYSNSFDESLEAIKSSGDLIFLSSGGSVVKTEGGKFVTDSEYWDTFGYKKPMGGDAGEYSFDIDMAVSNPRGGGPLESGGIGIRVSSGVHLFIDSGLWFMFRDSKVLATIKDKTPVSIDSLPVDFTKTVSLNCVDKGNEFIINYLDSKKAKKQLLRVVFNNDNSLTLFDSSNKEAGIIENHNLDKGGYVRYMSHYAGTEVDNFSITYKSDNIPDKLALMIGKFYAFKNKEKLNIDNKNDLVVPIIKNDRTFVPLRFIAEALGNEVAWDANTQTITIKSGDKDIKFVLGSTKMKKGTEESVIDAAPFIDEGRTMIPLRAAVESLDKNLKWDSANKLIIIANKTDEIVDADVSEFLKRYNLYEDKIYDDVSYIDEDYEELAKKFGLSTKGAFIYDQVPKDERMVGIAYGTWHGKDRWQNSWDFPLYGEYFSDNRDVMRLHAKQLGDAGVDFVFIDWSNNVNYDYYNKIDVAQKRARPDFELIESSTVKLFEEFSKVENAPKIAIFLGSPDETAPFTDGRLQKKADQVYDMFIKNEAFNKQYQYYLDKPLLIVYNGTPSKFQDGTGPWNDDRFTARFMTGYVTEQGNLKDKGTLLSKYGYWSWEDRGEQTFSAYEERPEAMTIVAACRDQGKPGDSSYIAARGRMDGDTFMSQWARARIIGPKIALVVSWNEWTKGEQPSPEISKDLEPSKVHGTFYLDLLKEEIAKFKGLK